MIICVTKTDTLPYHRAFIKWSGLLSSADIELLPMYFFNADEFDFELEECSDLFSFGGGI